MSETGIVSVGLAPLRRSPTHESEQVTQCLLGEAFEILGEAPDGAWWDVRLTVDGYRGWLRTWYGRRAASAYPAATARVSTGQEIAREEASRSARPVAVLPWQARVEVLGHDGAWTHVRLAGEQEAYLPKTSLSEGPNPGGPATGTRVLRTARRWLGSPYLWGGRTPAGFDCSGLTQAVWAWHGVPLPRDAAQQYRALVQTGKRRRSTGKGPGEESRVGDLLFFGTSPEAVTHVAIGAGNCEFVHAYGSVCAGSLNKSSETYVPQLIAMYLGAWVAGGPQLARPGTPGGRA